MVCDAKGYGFESYYSPFLESILFFKKNKIKKRIFKKNTFLIKKIKFKKINNFTKQYGLVELYNKKNQLNTNNTNTKKTLIMNISQKIYNNKATIIQQKNLYTFTIGSILKYFKVNQGKYVRRSLKGVKIFLNFLKNLLKKKFFLNQKNSYNYIIHVNGFDYNLFFLKKNLKNFFFRNKDNMFFITNLKINFNKKKDKKIKAIKKRLKKKIILNFIKSNKIKK